MMAARYDVRQVAADSLTMTGAQIAQKYGFSERWYYKLKEKADFQQAQAEAAAAAYSVAMDRARAYALEAVETLHGVMTDESAAAGARSQAAAQLISIAGQMQEQAEILGRIAAIEQAQEAGNNE